jgi:hypothetical protein
LGHNTLAIHERDFQGDRRLDRRYFAQFRVLRVNARSAGSLLPSEALQSS